MLNNEEKDKLMKQISIIIVLLAVAYGVSFLKNKYVAVKESENIESTEQIRMTASISSLDEVTRNKVLEIQKTI